MMHAFAKAAAPPKGPSGFSFIDAILRERPDMKDKMALYSRGQGGMANVVITHDEVFKGPKMTIDAKDFDQEVGIQKKLWQSGLPVPEITCVGKETIFFGMKRMPGVPLFNVYDEMTGEEKHALAKEIAKFIVDMALALPQKDGQYARHEDLHTGNILVDPDTMKLVAVIDFGKISYKSKAFLAHNISPDPHSQPFAQMVEHEYKKINGALDNNIIPSLRRGFSVLRSLAKSTFTSPRKIQLP